MAETATVFGPKVFSGSFNGDRKKCNKNPKSTKCQYSCSVSLSKALFCFFSPSLEDPSSVF